MQYNLNIEFFDERIIGSYTGEEKGDLVVCFGGMHGNEPAGVYAIHELFEKIQAEPSRNPDFCFAGKVLGYRGNIKALKKGIRFIDRDLNRLWKPDVVIRSTALPYEDLGPEEQEIKSILEHIEKEIKVYQPERLYIIDIHTTTAEGGIFTIPSRDPESQRIAMGINAPMVMGMLDGMNGTTLHFFNTENFGIPTYAVTFEAGQHNAPESVHNALAAIISCLRAIGCIPSKDVEPEHDRWILEHSDGLPRKTKLLYRHPIRPSDHFKMEPGFQNFQQVRKDDLLATDKSGEIRAFEDSLVLMPLYQKQGEDGFFLLKEVQD